MALNGQPKILIIEDDPAVSTLSVDLLVKDGFLVKTALTGNEGWNALQKEKFDLIVLDLGLPDMDGLELCTRIKKDGGLKDIPVFMLTARSSTDDIVRGLETGAEDYLPKPFNERELLARARAILRRREPLAPTTSNLISGKIQLSTASHEVWCSGNSITLTLREFDILRVFLAHEGKALTREEIVKMAWGPSTAIVPKVVDVHVGHLRAKLGSDGKRIETVPQVGYKLLPPKK
jgi:two-component system alkaline phosphatase synthesis response regulator PhoP